MDNNNYDLEILYRDYIAYLKTGLIDSLFTVQFVIKVKEVIPHMDHDNELKIILKSLIEEETKRHF